MKLPDSTAGMRALLPGSLLLFHLAAFSFAQSVPSVQNAQGAAAITLDQAIALAEANDPAYATSLAGQKSANLQRSISRSTLLPSVAYHNQYLYTQPNGEQNQAGQGVGSQSAPRFIANNAIREYASQALVTETLSPAGIPDINRSRALANKARADLEAARRDLVARVVSGYFGLVAAENRLAVTELGAEEAQAFLDLTQKREAGREAAHADVVKASLTLQQRKRELDDARLAGEKARLDLGALLFSDPRTGYMVASGGIDLLPSRDDVEAAAQKQNPDLKSALEAAQAAHEDVLAARAQFLPTLSLNYTYGIDAPQLAVNGPDHVRNLGYSASVSLDLPVWDWMASRDRVKQSEFEQQATHVALTAAQRRLIAEMQEFYDEARVANEQVASLDQSVQTAEENLRLSKLRYGAGEATALEVVDAQDLLLQSEVFRADGDLRYRIALANLETLTGVL